jgi:aspartate-semialdehyde dehydrogenase
LGKLGHSAGEELSAGMLFRRCAGLVTLSLLLPCLPGALGFAPSLRMTAGGGYKIGVVGATGAVGEEVVGCLARRNFAVDKLRLFTSSRSAGKVLKTALGDIAAEEFSVDKARECDFVFLAVDGDFSLQNARAISEGEGGAVVIDNSSAFRMDPDVPLVVPEINLHTVKGKKLIANPNCTTAIALMALWPLHRAFGIKRCIVSTYQAASGAGAAGMSELVEETKKYMTTGEMPSNKVFAHPLPLNVIPHIDKFQPNMYTKEEMKVSQQCLPACPIHGALRPPDELIR